MRYPLNRDPANEPSNGADGVSPSPSFPAVEDGILAFWKGVEIVRA